MQALIGVPESIATRWRALAVFCAVVMTAAAGYGLLHLPFEVSEVAANLLGFQAGPSAGQLVVETFTAPRWAGTGFLRSFSAATGKLLFDVSGGHYFLTYRIFHIALIAALLLSLVYLVRVESRVTLGLAVLSAASLLGIHTFHEAVRETETNIKLIVPACAFVLLCLSASEPARWKDVAAVILSFYGFFSNELGLLLWVVLVAAHLVGFRGVSRSAVLVVTVLLLLYFYLRFVQWDVGTPAMTERSSGLGFRMRDAPELISLFGTTPYLFYGYNVLVSVMTVLFAEPRSGAFLFLRDLLENRVATGLAIEVLSSTAMTLVMIWFAASRARFWMRREWSHDDRLFLVSLSVVAGNAAISFPYAKEVTMSTAGAFYALAMFPALRFVVSTWTSRRTIAWRAAAVYALLGCISIGMSIRAASFFVDLRRAAYRAQNDWVEVYDWMNSQQMAPPSPQGRELLDRYRTEVIRMDVPRVYREPSWMRPLDPVH